MLRSKGVSRLAVVLEPSECIVEYSREVVPVHHWGNQRAAGCTTVETYWA
jgi:hypothetical protein